MLPLSVQGRHQDAERKYNKAMHYLDPDSFEAEGPGVSADEVTQLGHAFIPCLLNRYKHAPSLPHHISPLACLRLTALRMHPVGYAAYNEKHGAGGHPYVKAFACSMAYLSGSGGVRCYTLECSDGVRRAASRLKMGDAEAAKVDCSRVLERVPSNAKALFRRAQAELELKVCLL